MQTHQIRELIRQELPTILKHDTEMQLWLHGLMQHNFAGKQETNDRFESLLEELRLDREKSERQWEKNRLQWEENRLQWEENNRRWEKSERKWDEDNRRWEKSERKWDEDNRRWEKSERKWEEDNRRWEENNRKWEENSKTIQEMLAQLAQSNRKFDQTLGALGARWGLHTEQSFRNALKGILEDTFKVQVLNINEYDDEGVVFGRPDQIELDLIISNGMLIVCEIKSSMSRSDVHIFDRKVAFYEQKHHCQASRRLIISPMVDAHGQKLAERLGIEVYSSSGAVRL